MDAFEKWVEDYALMHEREITKADCEAAFRAGMRAAATVYPDPQFPGRLTQYQRGVLAGVMRFRDAILAEADKP